jgi:hypothetical protein
MYVSYRILEVLKKCCYFSEVTLNLVAIKVETDIIASSRNTVSSLNKDKLWYIDTSDNVCWDFQNWGS